MIAVAAAVLMAAALAVFAVGNVEAVGLASGRTAIDITDLPFGPDKPEHIAMLEGAAERHGVDLALVTPDRDGTPAAFDVYILNGAFEPPTFWARSSPRPSSDVRDAVITWTYALDGAPDDVDALLRTLHDDGFVYSPASVSPRGALLAALSSPGIAGAVLAVIAAVLIALTAESRHRDARTRVRLLNGWSRRAVALREGIESLALVGTCAVPMMAVLAVFVAVRGASPTVVHLLTTTVAMLMVGLASTVAVAHVGIMRLAGRLGSRSRDARSGTMLVATISIGLVVLTTATGSSVASQLQTSRHLERTLAAEVSTGDDVTLGIGFANEAQDDALGAIGAEAIERGTARMAMTNFLQNALLVSDDGQRGVARAARDGATVLVPERLAGSASQITAAVEEAFADGWAVDDTAPARAVPVAVRVVPSTADLVRSAERWVTWGLPRNDASDDLPVVVLHTIRDLAPNRIGLAVHNSEVRFGDREALVSALRDSRAIDVVTQINRVGTTIADDLARVRTERSVQIGAGMVMVASLLLAAVQLAADHRRRTAQRCRLRMIVGRGTSGIHAPFVVACAVVTGATSLLTVLALLDGQGLRAAVFAGLTTVGATVGLVVVALLLTHRHRESLRPRPRLLHPRDRITR